MNTEVNNQEVQEVKEPAPIDVWHTEFQELMQKARTQQLFAPDVLFILNRAANEIQHQFNSILFTHEHKAQEGE